MQLAAGARRFIAVRWRRAGPVTKLLASTQQFR
jgi:hypothetical protein